MENRRRQEAIRAVAIRSPSATTLLFMEAIKLTERVLFHLGQTFLATSFRLLASWIEKKKDAETTRIISNGVPGSTTPPNIQNNLYSRPPYPGSSPSPSYGNSYPYGDNRPPAPPPVSTFPGFN